MKDRNEPTMPKKVYQYDPSKVVVRYGGREYQQKDSEALFAAMRGEEGTPTVRPKNREDVVSEYARRLAETGMPREDRRRRVIEFRKRLTREGKV